LASRKVVGWTTEIVRHPPKRRLLMRIWIRERAKEAMKIEREKLQEEPKHPRESLLAEKVDSGEDLLVALSQ